MQLQEDILRGLFGEEAIGEDAQRDAEDPVLVLQQECAEGLLSSVVQVKIPAFNCVYACGGGGGCRNVGDGGWGSRGAEYERVSGESEDYPER